MDNFDSFEVVEPLTRRVAGILQDYPDGTQIARELLQNSEDACSTVQWYLLDHRHHPTDPERLFDPRMQAYQGPALLAGNDSLFEQGDFKSLRNLAASGKKDDERKIGQMGIGFNSVYHMTDTPSFISGDKMVILEPHTRIFNGLPYRGGVQGSFTNNGQGMKKFPGQLELFAAKDKIDFSKPYNGTIFRFPLRTEAQAEVSELSKSAYPAEKVRDMLMNLKNEAIKCLLFLKYIEKMTIYERRENDPTVYKLFEIEIVNNAEVRAERQAFMAQLKSHVYASDDDDHDKTLQYAIRPLFRLTHEDGTVTEEEWAVVGYIGNVPEARRIMKADFKADIANQRMIPWVGLAAPVDPAASVGTSNLFCFLPLGIHTPHPVHINGHFAVKQSRREIWTNYTDDISSQSSAGIKSNWNEFLFKSILPVAYARLLDSIGTSHGANYELWPRTRASDLGMETLWKDLLRQCIEEVTTSDNYEVFFADSVDGEPSAVSYQMATIADPVMDEYPLLLDLLKGIVNLVCGVPENIASVLRQVVDATGVPDNILTPQKVRDLLREHKHSWQDSTSDEAKVEILNYCIRDDQFADLEGLPLLPMADGSWVEFKHKLAYSRYLVDPQTYRVLQFANENVVNIQLKDLPAAKGVFYGFGKFMSTLTNDEFVRKVRDTIRSKLYDGRDPPPGAIAQPSAGLFPSLEWIIDVWTLLHRPDLTEATLKPLLGCHLVPIEGGLLAPLDRSCQIIDRSGVLPNSLGADRVLDLLGTHLECYVVRSGLEDWFSWWSQCFISVADIGAILLLLADKSSATFAILTPPQRQLLCKFISVTLSSQESLSGSQRQSLERLPIYQGYVSSDLKSLHDLGGVRTSMICLGFSSEDRPWKLTSVTLLKEDQPMSDHIRYFFNVRVIQESEYWYRLFSEFAEANSDNKGQWNPIMKAFLPSYYRHPHNLKALLRDLPFVDVQSNGSMAAGSAPSMKLSPTMVVSQDLAQFFFQDEAVFPAGIYGQLFNLAVLADLGMSTYFDAKFSARRLEKISSMYAESLNNNRGTLQVILRFFERLHVEANHSYRGDGKFVKCIKDLAWVPARVRTGEPFRLYKPDQCRPKTDRLVVGTQLPTSPFVCTNMYLSSLMGWANPPPLRAVLANLLDLSARSLAGRCPDNFEELINAICRDLNSRIQDSQAVSIMKETLASHRCIPVNRSFQAIDRVAIKIRSGCNLAPHFIQVPKSDFVGLFRALGVREEVTPKDMEGILVTINSGYQDGGRLSDDDAKLVVRILETIASVTRSSAYSPDMLILTEGSQLRKLSDVVYNDMAGSSSTQEYSSSYVFSSKRISKEVASELHIQMLSEKIWSGCNDDFFQNWEQEISVVDSISKILNDYGPDNIFTEYLQNAADAGATQLSIMLDHQFHSCDGILNKKMSVGQGPALLIWNDAEFTQEDFEGLRKMAMGSKRHDPEKIGRHGLGFNTAYHLTDLPSVVSGRHLVIFDPKHAYLPKRQTRNGVASDGAVRIDFIESQLAQKFPGQVAPYQDRFGCDMTAHFHGTLFRLPLRRFSTMTNRDSSAFGEVWDAARVRLLINQWAEDAKISMLFLKQIKTINVISEADKWTVVKDSESVRGMSENAGSVTSFDMVRIRAYGPRDQPSANSTWLVGIDDTYPTAASTIRDIAQDGRWIPHRGIAMPLEQPKGDARTAFEGRIFSYLPTPIATDLPFHVHGVFALISNRKGLVTSPAHNSHAANWNEYMLSTLLPPLIVQTMSCLLRFKFGCLDTRQPRTGIDGAFHAILGAYFKLWPLRSSGDMTSMVQRFWELAHTSLIFPVRPLRQETDAPVVQGFAGKDVCFPMRKAPPLDVLPKLEQLLRENDVPLCECIQAVSSSALYHWSKASLTMIQTDASLLRKVLRGNSDFMLKIRSQDGRDWLLELLLGFLLDKDEDGIDHLNGLVLLPLEDDTWVSLSPNPAYYTASTTARSLFKNHKTLVKESAFTTSKLPKILKALEKDPRYGITPLPPAKFTEYVCLENSAGIPQPKLLRVWEYIRASTDLTGFGDLPILTTIWGTVVPLRNCQGALRVSQNDRLDSGSMLHKLGQVLQRAGIIVFQLEKNDKHKYLEAKSGPYSDSSVISAFVKSGGSLNSMMFDSNEASTLREAIQSAVNEFSHGVMTDLGFLRIWPSYGAAHGESGLICAHGNQIIDGGHDIRNLGDSHNVIQGTYSDTVKRLGAHSVHLTDFTRERVIPRLQSQVITPISNKTHMAAYIQLLKNLVRIATTKSNQRSEAQHLLQSGSLILARDGSLHACNDLLDPHDTLLTTIYRHNSSNRFPSQEVYTALHSGGSTVAKFRQSTQDPVLIECANTVLEETVKRPHAEATKTMARALVVKIYTKPSSANWMQSRWKVVPISESLPAPYSSSAPYLPAYMSFSDLILKDYQDIAWTQCGFFPSDLEPPQNCRDVWAEVGQPRIQVIVDHLHSLAKDLASTWTSNSEQLQLQLTLINTYTALNKYASKSDVNSTTLSSLLTIMTVPYIFNSFEKEICDPEAWQWPDQLILDVENPTATHRLVHSKLTQFRSFLAAAGVHEMLSVAGDVRVAPAPPPSEFVTMLCNLFESQDRTSGFMDVCFRFYPGGQDIFAHKIVLAHRSKHFKIRFLGVWAQHVTRDRDDPTLEIVDMSSLTNGDHGFRASFWGVLYYLYSYNLTPLNGLPVTSQESQAQSVSMQDPLSERVEYLLLLLKRADEYRISRLKDLIAYELVFRRMIVQGNVFTVREHADLARCRPIVEHCEKYIKANAISLKSFVKGEIAALQKELHKSGRDKDGRETVVMKEEKAEHETHLQAIDEILKK